MDLSKKSGIVTGGGSGIGKAVVTHLAGLGASVLVADNHLARGESLVSKSWK